MSKKQTAVDWLIENLHTAKNAFDQAKAMEKEQIMQSYNDGKAAAVNVFNNKSLEQYYNETYGNE
jgi:hypothetical protein